MIQGFDCSDTELLYRIGRSRRWDSISNVAMRKLTQLDAAASLDFLKSPPGNRFEALRGDRAGQFSIRINDQFRLCFTWTSKGPDHVEIVDYH